MARRQVIEVKCDRCGKTETQENRNHSGASVPTEMTVSFQGKTVSYEDLCTRCRGACEGYFKSITKQTEKIKEEAPKKSGLLGLGGRKTG